jgi:PPOX class probable F420-dependent enzyme
MRLPPSGGPVRHDGAMDEPHPARPYMPGYGIDPGTEGLLPWTWAVERLDAAHELWLATVRPDGRPHVMPVWALRLDDAVWFSTSPESRKARNLRAEPRCTITTDDTRRPVILDGRAELVTDADSVARFTAAINAKYGTDHSVDFFAANHLYRVVPTTVFGLEEERFTDSPTRWAFPS